MTNDEAISLVQRCIAALSEHGLPWIADEVSSPGERTFWTAESTMKQLPVGQAGISEAECSEKKDAELIAGSVNVLPTVLAKLLAGFMRHRPYLSDVKRGCALCASGARYQMQPLLRVGGSFDLYSDDWFPCEDFKENVSLLYSVATALNVDLGKWTDEDIARLKKMAAASRARFEWI